MCEISLTQVTSVLIETYTALELNRSSLAGKCLRENGRLTPAAVSL